MDAEGARDDSQTHLVVSFDDAEIIVERENVQLCRSVIRVDHETAATADVPCCIVRGREKGLDADVTVAAVALAEVRGGLAAMEFVEGRACGIDDVCAEQICAPDGKCV